jgi:hypothetical protein
MRKLMFVLTASVLPLATAAIASQPVTGEVCTKYKAGTCVSTHKVRGTPGYKVGYVFGPKYGYTALTDLPPAMVTEYKLDPNTRYVYSDGYIYAVDPSTYAVTQVITAMPH